MTIISTLVWIPVAVMPLALLVRYGSRLVSSL